MKDFTKYFEENRLGRLYFPNGYSSLSNEDFNGGRTTLRIDLRDLYKGIVGWKINHNEIPLDDIIAVISFGSAVKHPDAGTTSIFRKKYFLFGPDIVKREKINPRDTDFYILTDKNLTKEKCISTKQTRGEYGFLSIVYEGGIHLIHRGINQLLNGIKEEDTVSINALKEGVPIFFNGRLENVIEKSGIRKETPRKIYWEENRNGDLFGEIK